MDEKAVEL